MSYRGSFATEYIYSKDCFNIVKEVLLLYYWDDVMVCKEHMISGKVSYLSDEDIEIEFENLLEEISDKIKDDDFIRIILFGETFTTYYKVSKDKVDVIYKEKLEWENKRK